MSTIMTTIQRQRGGGPAGRLNKRATRSDGRIFEHGSISGGDGWVCIVIEVGNPSNVHVAGGIKARDRLAVERRLITAA
jgi:hypothetical protein